MAQAKIRRPKRSTKSHQLKYHRSSRNRAFVRYPKGCRKRAVQEWLPGPYDSPQSRAAFEKSLGYYLTYHQIPPWVGAGQSTPAETPQDPAQKPAGLTVEQLCDAFAEEKAREYCPGEIAHYRSSLKRLRLLFGKRPAESIGRRQLKEVRQLMIRAGSCVKTINGQVRRLKAVFVWAAEEELIPDEVPAALAALRPLKRGQAKANGHVGPVCDALVEQTCRHLPPEAADLVRLLRISGARCGELFAMRGQDIQIKDKRLWIYRPARHKNSWRGHDRSIKFGPRAIALLRPVLAARPAAELLFVRPAWSDPRNRNRHTIGTAWDRCAFGHLIQRTCARFGLEHWHPHQLRHSAATEAYNRPGGSVSGAQRLLGHARASTTETYIQAQDDPAEQLARQFG